MKRFGLLLCAASLLVAQQIEAASGAIATGHTFFSVRPHFETGSPEREAFFRNEKVDARENGWGGAMQAVVYGGQSVKSCRLAEFFMPFGKRSLNVFEFDPTVGDPTGGDLNPAKDVEARNFNIHTVNGTFNSVIEFSPEQKYIGIGFSYKQALWRCDDHSNLWLEVAFPVERIQNSMGLTEKVNNDGGGAAAGTGLDGTPFQANMIEAFNQDGWKYGKINACHHLTKWGVGYLELKLNWSSAYNDCCRLDTFIGMIAPTGSKVDAKNAAYVFSPVVGNNHHWGFLFGGEMQFKLWECGKHSLSSAYDLSGRLLLKNHQIRSFDLEDKQWGRYLALYTQPQAAAAFAAVDPNSGTSGINQFTRKVQVEPRYSADSNSALIYRYCGLSVEAGYNLFIREAERICPATPWITTDSSSAAIAAAACDQNHPLAIQSILGDGALNQARTIGKNFDGADEPYNVSNFANMQLQQNSADLDSAAHPAIISNTIYGGIGYEWDACTVPMFVALGGSYEFSRANTTLERWMAFGKFGLSF